MKRSSKTLPETHTHTLLTHLFLNPRSQ